MIVRLTFKNLEQITIQNVINVSLIRRTITINTKDKFLIYRINEIRHMNILGE